MPRAGPQRSDPTASRRFRRASRRHSATADWSTVDAELIREAIATVAADGGALRFGYSRDGGAYAVGVLGDGDPYTEYIRPADDPDAWFREFAADWRDLGSPTPGET